MGKDTDVVTIKSILLVVMLIVSAICIGLPILTMQLRRLKEGNASRRKFILSVLNCFGGGIFVAVGFLHLLPEVVEDMESAFEELFSKEQAYPFAYFVVCVGFLIVLLIEHLVLSCERNKQKLEDIETSGSRKTNIHNGLSGATVLGILTESLKATGNDDPSTKSPETNNSSDNISLNDENYSEERTYSYIQSEEMMVKNQSTLHAVTIALALAVHSVFGGLAFGLQETKNQVLQVFIAIIVHKSVLAFSLGINFVTTQVRWKTSLLLAVIFCLASPVGGAVGTILAASDGESVTITLLSAILSGIATGTFFYVAFIEVISHEMTSIEPQYKSQRLLLVLAIMIGFAVFAGLSFLHD